MEFGRWAQRIFRANLVAQIAIVVTGGLVRLTGSGLGCPTWPECFPGSYTPVAEAEQAWHTYVEFGNRTLTFVLGLLALAGVAVAIRHVVAARPGGVAPRRVVVVLAWVPLAGTLGQAILGGITVVTGLNPGIVAAHFLLSLLIIAACVVLVVRSGEAGDAPMHIVVRRELRWASVLALGLASVVVVLGTLVTGSGPHAGDASAPRFGLDPRTVAWVHADAVILYLGVLLALWLGLRLTAAPVAPRRWVLISLGVALAQGAVGYVQYFTGLPWLVVAFHLLGACLVWASTVRLALAMRTRGAVSAAPADSFVTTA